MADKADTRPTHESVGVRYVVTLVAQLVRLALAFLSASIVPRTLGPAAYGNYTYLLSAAATLRGFVDNGTQQAFFTFSARERTSGPLTKLYAMVLAAQFVAVLLLIGFCAVVDRVDWLWPDQQLDQIVYVMILDWAVFLALSLQQLGDSKAHTVYPQLLGTLSAVVVLAGLLVLWATETLDFYTFVWLNIAGGGVTCGLLGYWLIARHRSVLWDGPVEYRNLARRWWRFARPLLFVQYYLPIVAYAGLYLVQRWYGSDEQGYYGLALQWSALAMVFTNASITIFWREVAFHTANGAKHNAAVAYERFSRLFVALVVAVACWLSLSSDVLVRTIAGEQYAPAAAVLAIMAFYPVAQTLGQLTTTSLKAMELTSTYARWSLILSVPDLLLTYFLLAPSAAPMPGLELGAVGLAIKTALYGLVGVHVFDWVTCRVLAIDYAALFWRRIVAAFAIGAIAVVILGFGGRWLRSNGVGDIPVLIAASLLYALALGTVMWLRPEIAGVSREELRRVLRLPGGLSLGR